MEITGTMATTIKAMVDTGAMITRVTTTTTDMVTTAVCNTVCERTDEKTKEILYRGLSVLDPDYDSCALNYLSRMHMRVSYMPYASKEKTLEHCCSCFLFYREGLLAQSYTVHMYYNNYGAKYRKGCLSFKTHLSKCL